VTRRRVDFVEVLGAAGAYGFIFCLYSSPAHWVPALEVLRPALLAALLTLAAVGCQKVLRGQPIRMAGGIGGAMLALFGLVALSPLWALDVPVAKGYAIDAMKLPMGFAGLVGVLRTPARLRRAMAAGALAAMVPAWGAIGRYRDGVELVEGFRAAWIGLLANPNALAMVMAMTVPWTLLETERSRGRRKALFLLAFSLQCAALVTTHSRGGALGLAAAVLAAAALSRNRARAFALAAVATTAVVAFAPQTFWSRTQTIGAYQQDASAQGRLKAWDAGFRALDERPLLGVGIGGYSSSWDRYMPRNVRERAYASHNTWMQVLVELGGLGAAAFAAMVGLVVSGLWRARRSSLLGDEARALLASMAAVFVCGFTGGYAFSWFFYLLLGFGGAVVAIERAGGTAEERAHGLDVAVA
jgi:O-antigen ligase